MTPDYKGFAQAIMGEWPGLHDIESSEVFEAAEKYGLITAIPGGFNPDEHIDAHGVGLEAGDPPYEFTNQEHD